MNMVFQGFLLLLMLSLKVIILSPNIISPNNAADLQDESGTFQILFSPNPDFHHDGTSLLIFFMEGKFHPFTKELKVFLVWAGTFGCKLLCITSNQSFLSHFVTSCHAQLFYATSNFFALSQNTENHRII